MAKKIPDMWIFSTPNVGWGGGRGASRRETEVYSLRNLRVSASLYIPKSRRTYSGLHYTWWYSSADESLGSSTDVPTVRKEGLGSLQLQPHVPKIKRDFPRK